MSEEKYPFVGKLSRNWLDHNYARHPDRKCVVVGENSRGFNYTLIWAGTKTRQSYHKSFIEKVTPFIDTTFENIFVSPTEDDALTKQGRSDSG